MKLYFGNAVTAATTIMIIAMLGFIAYNVFNRAEIQCWGRRSLLLLVFGLAICCFAAARDGLDKTIQYTIDGDCDPGIFSLMSLPVIIGCIGALIIIIAAVATPATKSQAAREIWFYIMSGGVMLKVITMEISRLLIH